MCQRVLEEQKAVQGVSEKQCKKRRALLFEGRGGGGGISARTDFISHHEGGLTSRNRALALFLFYLVCSRSTSSPQRSFSLASPLVSLPRR